MISGKFRNAVDNIMDKKKRSASKSPSLQRSTRRSGQQRLPNRYRHMSVYNSKSKAAKAAAVDSSSTRRGSLDSMQDNSNQLRSDTYNNQSTNVWYPDRLQCVIIGRGYAQDDAIKHQMANHIFELFFELQPEALRMFPVFKQYKDVRIVLRSADMYRHMNRLIAVIDHVIDNLHHRTDVIRYLREVGTRHRTLNDNIRPSYWRAMGDSIRAALLWIPQTSELTFEQGTILRHELWPKLAVLMTTLVREGYEKSHSEYGPTE